MFAPMPPRFGPYEVIERLASGPRRQRYLARRDGQDLLLVQLPAWGDPGIASVWLDEAGLWKILRHPNIARLDDVGCIDGIAFFAYEYVHGGDLRRLIARGAVELGAAVGVAIQVCAGLHHAHERMHHGHPLLIVHRDLRPGNVLVGDDGTVKIGDFGLIRGWGQPQPDLDDPRPYAYMSPEQLRGSAVDRGADLYALGVVLYELTTGARAFDAPTALEMFHAIRDGRCAPPSRRVAGYPAALERVVMRAMAADRAARYQTAEALQHALEHVARELGLDVSPAHLARGKTTPGA